MSAPRAWTSAIAKLIINYSFDAGLHIRLNAGQKEMCIHSVAQKDSSTVIMNDSGDEGTDKSDMAAPRQVLIRSFGRGWCKATSIWAQG